MSQKSVHTNGASSLAPSDYEAERARIAREICRDAVRQPNSLLLEQWASMLLGNLWDLRHRADAESVDDALLFFGRPIFRSIAVLGNADAKLALETLSRIARGALGRCAHGLAGRISWPTADRVRDVGTTRLVRAFCASSPGEGEAILFETDATGERRHTLVIYIDEWSDGIAKHVRLLRPFNPMSPGVGLGFRPAGLAAMRQKASEAIALTDSAADPPVDESFSGYRALALARLNPLDGPSDGVGPL